MASIAFISIIGAAIYEHAAVVPVWSIAPPRSLSMFQGEYGIKPINFWMPVHPVTVLLLAAALMANWKEQRRKQILIVLCCYLLILAITATYFVPELIAITTSAYSAAVSGDLAARASTWEMLSLLRLSVLLILAATLLRSLSMQTQVR
ncbi:hypothetical protein [Dyadobacter psychrophilus]|uniref:DUF1772 domain-containing protein n=1 Tax=Dyadobacter psychrophilus TaxID=651661 RepID=A0A1T5DID6_9BACT|nr:hypothetical protein [Dyadobacter psychrophilus]SKB71484.1 hypothetical protein SAMN05660293_01642 [Dyadobacter psychrophilus]